MKRALIAAALLLICAGAANASAFAATESSAASVIDIPKTTVAPPMDGDVSNPAWKSARVIPYDYDLRLHKTSGNKTTAMIMTDGKDLYVAFDAKQAEPVTAQQHTNNVGVDTDDEVQIDLWPAGTSGFRYLFISAPLGTHYQFSSENNSYEPTWYSAGKVTPAGFTVTMRIPLSVMRGGKDGAWRVQFARLNMKSGEDLCWMHGPDQQNHNDVTYAGFLHGVPTVAAMRPQPRVGIYSLAQAGSPDTGGNTSRAGADVAIPITNGTSLVATIHPDFSNVEADQQSIAPTAFRRSLTELRPFFTQGANFYNWFSCVGCPGIQELYTPSIPTPREGYAIEGKEGRFGLAAFDAVGFGRTDSAQSLHWGRPDSRLGFSAQRIAVNMPGLKDDVLTVGGVYDNLRNRFGYFNYGSDSGTLVKNAGDAQRYDGGIGLYSPTTFIGASVRRLGTYYNPYDGFVNNSGIAGYNLNASKDFLYDAKSQYKRFSIFGSIDRYHPTAGPGHFNQTDENAGIELLTKNLWRFHAETGAAYVVTSDKVFNPITQNFYSVTYRSGTSTPTQLSLSRGRFGPGMLDSWSATSAIRSGRRGSINLEADKTAQYLDAGGANTQWLERVSYAYQLSSDASFAIGLRKITGFAPYLTPQSPVVPNFAGFYTQSTNFTASYHGKAGPWEIYAAYGNASVLDTRHAFILKVIKYIGAQKGT